MSDAFRSTIRIEWLRFNVSDRIIEGRKEAAEALVAAWAELGTIDGEDIRRLIEEFLSIVRSERCFEYSYSRYFTEFPVTSSFP